MADAFAELDEVMRQERAERFWKENGKTLIVAVIATIVLTGLISAYRSWDTHVKEKQTAQLIAALDSENAATELQKIADDVRPGVRGMALLNAGRVLSADGKKEDAIKVYQKAAEDSSIPDELRDLAVLMDVNLTQATPENKDGLLQKLQKVASNDKSPWRFHARLEAASLLAHTAHDYKAAQAELKYITASEEVPASLKAKAVALTQVYTMEAPQEEAQTQ